MTQDKPVRILVTGWFSFEGTGAGGGDLLAKDLVCEWIEGAGHAYDVALAPPFRGGVDWNSVDPTDYSHVVFVCGPFYKSNLLQRFATCHLIGTNLSMAEPVESWNPFDLLLERDSSTTSRPDITFLAHEARVPVVGLALGGTNENAGGSHTYESANAAIQQLVASQKMSAVPIDTRLDIPNTSGLRSPAEIESLIARMDVVLTTRLHGMVFALKNGVPVIAVDPIAGGDKLRRQARSVGWPLAFCVDDVTSEQLQQAFAYCLTDAARLKALECRRLAVKKVEELRDTFIDAIGRPPVEGGTWGDGRRRGAWLVHDAVAPSRNSGVNRSLNGAVPIDLGRRVLSRFKKALVQLSSIGVT